MKKVKKAVIPAAGLGTRFLPATKAIPKEMLPIVNKPTIQYIVEEAIASGIEEILIVTRKGKQAMEDHFDHAFELENHLFEKRKFELLEKIQATSKVNIHFIRQKEPKGLGHAVWCARNFVGDEPFAVLLGDDIVVAKSPGLKQLINAYEQTISPIIGVKEVPEDETHRYGIIDPDKQYEDQYAIKDVIEKPKQGTAPSNLAIIGRYVLTPDIFMFLEKQEVGVGGEIQLTDAIQRLNSMKRVFALEVSGERFDVGEKLGFINATIEFALKDHTIRDEVLKLMENKMNHELRRENVRETVKMK